jgi:AcrR family transcriptional regulator
MASRRRIGVEGSETWTLLLDTAEKIMREEGYPAVTTRRLASRMGVSSQLVHYYFRSMDDLFLALMRRGQERSIGRLIQAFTSEEPLRALWDLYSDKDFSRLALEFMALTNHRKSICAEAARSSKHMRSLEAKALARVLAARGVDSKMYPATGLALLLSAIPRVMVLEATLGVTLGHAEATAMVDRFFNGLSGSRKTGRKVPTLGKVHAHIGSKGRNSDEVS